MKTKISIGIIILAIFTIAVFMNPAKEMHVQKISDIIENPLSNLDTSTLDGLILIVPPMFNDLMSFEVTYTDYWFCSIGHYNSESDIYSIGVFGKVFIISN